MELPLVEVSILVFSGLRKQPKRCPYLVKTLTEEGEVPKGYQGCDVIQIPKHVGNGAIIVVTQVMIDQPVLGSLLHEPVQRAKDPEQY